MILYQKTGASRAKLARVCLDAESYSFYSIRAGFGKPKIRAIRGVPIYA
jgi:hypothetical protein